MAVEKDERSEPRKLLRNSYVEYTKEGTRLSWLFRADTKRGLIVNLCKNGIAFRTVEPLKEGDRLFLTLRIQGAQPSKLKAEVRWVRPERKIGTEEYTHIVGARFLEYSPEAWVTIQQVLKT